MLILYAAVDTGIDLSVCQQNQKNCEAHSFPNVRHMNFSDAAILPSRFPLPKAVLLLGAADGLAFLREVSDRLRYFFQGDTF